MWGKFAKSVGTVTYSVNMDSHFRLESPPIGEAKGISLLNIANPMIKFLP